MKLHLKIILFFSTVIIIVVGGISIVVFDHMTNTLETQMGNNAMDLAVTVAAIDDVQRALAFKEDYHAVQDYIEGFRENTRFQYIIVMDMEGIQYSYPYESGIGKRYRNGGENAVLTEGKSYTSADRNVLISAIRAFTPVYYQGEQVGAVLVGLLTDRVNQENKQNQTTLELALGIGLFIGIIGSVLLSYNIKESIFKLEPKEIALLLGQREVILKSILQGIIAIDKTGRILIYNDTAKNFLELPDDAEGQDIRVFHRKFASLLMGALEHGKEESNKEVRLSLQKTILCNYCLMRGRKDEMIGVVVSFEDLTNVKKMAEELTGYRSVVNALRAQNHEFMNKLHTISGLIQLEEYDEAIDYIDQIKDNRALFSSIISKQIMNVHVAAILLVKYNKLKEEKIEMVVDSKSYLESELGIIREDEICSVIGNLIDNAEDALLGQQGARVEVYIHSSDQAITIKIKDNGQGIKKELEDRIFESGVTTKKGSRGYGLFIVKDIIERVGGAVDFINDHGVQWNVVIPKYDNPRGKKR